MQLSQICGPVLPVSHILVTLFILSTTTGSYAVVACKPCLYQSNILVRTLLRLFKQHWRPWAFRKHIKFALPQTVGVIRIINAAERLQMTRLAWTQSLPGSNKCFERRFSVVSSSGCMYIRSFSYSWKKSELSKVQSEMKLPQH